MLPIYLSCSGEDCGEEGDQKIGRWGDKAGPGKLRLVGYLVRSEACFQGLWLLIAMGSPTACQSNGETLTAQVITVPAVATQLSYMFFHWSYELSVLLFCGIHNKLSFCSVHLGSSWKSEETACQPLLIKLRTMWPVRWPSCDLVWIICWVSLSWGLLMSEPCIQQNLWCIEASTSVWPVCTVNIWDKDGLACHVCGICPLKTISTVQ